MEMKMNTKLEMDAILSAYKSQSKEPVTPENIERFLRAYPIIETQSYLAKSEYQREVFNSLFPDIVPSPLSQAFTS